MTKIDAIRAGLLVTVAMAVAPHMQAQTVPAGFKVIDDFTKNRDTISGTGATTTKIDKEAAIEFWSRAITLTFGSNPYAQPVEVQVLPNPGNGLTPAFVWSVGYGIYERIDLEYYAQGSAPATINFSGYDRFRVAFSGLSNVLNFNFVAAQGTNNEGLTCGVNLGPSTTPFTVDFPFNQYVFNGGTQLDFSVTNLMDVVFQGGPNLAITGIYAIPTGAVLNGPAGSPSGPASYTCGAPPPAAIAASH